MAHLLLIKIKNYMSNVHLFEKPGMGAHLTQTMIFKQLWLYSNKKSFVSGLYLREFMNTPYFFNCFSHVLAKGMSKYPYFKYYARNIVLLTPGEHALLDHDDEAHRIKYAEEHNVTWEPLYELRDSLID
jgi:hypothetical protein